MCCGLHALLHWRVCTRLSSVASECTHFLPALRIGAVLASHQRFAHSSACLSYCRDVWSKVRFTLAAATGCECVRFYGHRQFISTALGAGAYSRDFTVIRPSF